MSTLPQHYSKKVPHVSLAVVLEPGKYSVYEIQINQEEKGSEVQIFCRASADLVRYPLPIWDVLVKAVEDLRNQ